WLQVVEPDVLGAIEMVFGSAHSEFITGNEQDNILFGNGDDIIDGGLGNDVIVDGNVPGAVPSTDTVSYASHDGVTEVVGTDIISLGQNGADGSYTRQGLVSTPTPHIAVVETDALRGIENASGSNRPEAIIGNEQANTLSGRGGDDSISG